MSDYKDMTKKLYDPYLPRVINNIKVGIYILFFLCIMFLKGQDISHQDSTFSLKLIPFAVKQDPLFIYHSDNIFSPQINLKYPAKEITYYRNFYSPKITIPSNPLQLDYRISSSYVPVHVRNEITHIMDRPYDSNFVPLFGMALLAVKLASQFLIIQDKIRISADNIIHSRDAMDILKQLWNKSPLTNTELYDLKDIREKLTFHQLEKKVSILTDNKLVKEKRIENNQIQLFPAKSKEELIDLIEKMLSEKEYSDKIYQDLYSILTSIR
jgi:hypothetical protein